MFEIAIQRNIKDYKGKALLGMTMRQIICLVLGFGITVPMYLFLKDTVNETLLSYVVLGIGAFFFMVGFVPMGGMPFEKYAYYMIECAFLKPRIRVYRSITVEEAIVEEQYEAKLKRIKEIDKLLSQK